ncbi:hypothetical protein [Nostoc sp. ChiVER01]|uniref:hypothetical protein n=1 Tax=Nostoc sp. ChiVER01 TaxID=3075382 RepID=UPI002AD2FD8B|nr:hypothetical protein [Nostoc sp. ChiVER01]MDZ8227542.1 hypothetical protein [Nostoc sp. ChiVER01]
MTNNPWRIEMINLIGDEVERLQRQSDCTLKYRDYLEKNYGTREYSTLDKAQLKKFWKHLKSLTVEKLSREPNEQIWLKPHRIKKADRESPVRRSMFPCQNLITNDHE